MDSFLKELEVELRPAINKVLAHPFLKKLADGELSLSQLRDFSMQYNLYSGNFPRCLAAVAANVPDDATRLSLIKNMWEEHGEGDISKSHRTLFFRFLGALGLSENDYQSITPLQTTQEYIDAIFALCHNSHFLEGLGGMSVGTEFFTDEEFSIILSGMRKYDFLSSADLEYWSIHIEMDEGHYAEMAESITPWIVSDENKSLIRQGAHRAIELEMRFWDGLYKAFVE